MPEDRFIGDAVNAGEEAAEDHAELTGMVAETTTGTAAVAVGDMAEALTRAPFTYANGATQAFTADGSTTYTENGSVTSGEWGVDGQGRFWSFWPPAYRAEYDVFWITDADDVVGVRFIELGRGAVFEGRYSPKLNTESG